jgi:hypothetical protein
MVFSGRCQDSFIIQRKALWCQFLMLRDLTFSLTFVREKSRGDDRKFGS